jgi:hypothetical protein
MAASASRRDRLNGGSATLAVSVAGPSARRMPHVQVFRAICINISENVQETAAVMVTVSTPQCTTRASSKRPPLRQAPSWLCHYDLL